MSFFERERETRSSIPNVIVFLALLSSLSFFQKSDDETAFQIPPTRCARERERESKEKERRRNDDDDDFAVVARVIKTLGDGTKGPQRSSRKGKRKDPRERMNE